MNPAAAQVRFSPAMVGAVLLSLAAHAGAMAWIAPHGPDAAARPLGFDPISVTLAGEPAPAVRRMARTGMPKTDAAPVPAANAASAAAAAPDTPDSGDTADTGDRDAPLVRSRYDVAALHNPKPPYPLAARSRGIEGRVVVRARVTEEGRCAALELHQSSGHALLDQSVLQTVKQWRFIPASRDGVAVASWVDIPVAFRLHD